MKAKRVLSMVLSFALVLGSFTGITGNRAKAEEAAKKIVVYVAAEGETASGPAIRIDKTPVQVTEGDTAEVAVKQVLDAKYQDNYEYSNGFLSSIGGLAGSSSAPWVYWGFKVNGTEPQNPSTGWGYGIGDYPVQDNDQISLVYGTYEDMPNQCSSYDNDESKMPNETEQATILENAKGQEKLLAEKIYEVNFQKGAYVPGIEDTDSLYAVFSLAQAGFKADAFYDNVCKKILSQLQGMKEQGKIYDSSTNQEMSFASLEGNKYVLINYTKIALVLSALGVDITKAGGVNLAEKMTDKSFYQVANPTTFTRESLILFAMNASGAAWPTGEQYLTEGEMVNNLLADVDNEIGVSTDLNNQWGATLDSAAMVVQALAPYQTKKLEGVDTAAAAAACTKVMNLLSTMQDNQTGGFAGASDNAWTLAQSMITVGLLESNTSPLHDTAFIKNGKTLFDASAKYVDVEKGVVDENLVGGRYAYQPEQLLRGLTSCIRRVEGKSLFDTTSPAYKANTTYTLLSAANVSKIASQTYTGKAITPSVVVTVAGKKLVKGEDYTVSYYNNIKVGTAYVVVTGIGNYRLSVKVPFQIVKTVNKTQSGKNNGKKVTLKKPVIKKLSSTKKRTLTVKFGKVSKAKKYVIQIATDKKFKKNAKKKTVTSVKKVTFKKLKAGKKYYVRVRAYNGSVKSAYSKVKTKKVKKK